MIDVEWQRERGVRVAALRGRIDSSNAADFLATIEEGLGSDDGKLLLDIYARALHKQCETARLSDHRAPLFGTGQVFRDLRAIPVQPRHRDRRRLRQNHLAARNPDRTHSAPFDPESRSGRPLGHSTGRYRSIAWLTISRNRRTGLLPLGVWVNTSTINCSPGSTKALVPSEPPCENTPSSDTDHPYP